MTDHSTYETLRHFADSWGLLVMVILFAGLVAWPFRPGSKKRNRDAADLIFKDDDNGE
ncbi:cb-type cytochrome c oxidase subunit IV [Aurantiacibacter atlanticus]|uniref:Cb-type cytochrome c oxidase subunit IV n=1 Tax=Aurantiacibacter atlanticus TaxID=1648404 RepID=A0A161J4F0_9SPHN|nr:cbb3-type cytochrome c oxidase subunit 3 [Aurantiacibacter atlanticus]ANC50509.1 cb-type cytochrome c oxidase subunit IV [Aurantiacibacter atlanticus]MDF1835025.1 cbb3-type cytochrome c oxidase subunit 3 [Alteraurantiacibacter sp. bin_em_oilr2.035]